MLTQIGAEFWVIMSEKTPPFPTTNRLPLLIENAQTKDIEFKITNPYDTEVKVFDNAAAAQSDIDVFKDACKRKGHEVNFGIYPFKVECQVRVASAAEVNGWSNNMPPTEPSISIPVPNLHESTVKFKRIKVEYFDISGNPQTDEIPVTRFVPWIFRQIQKNTKEYYLFRGFKSAFDVLKSTMNHDTARASSVRISEKEYKRLLKIHKKFLEYPENFILEDK